MFHLRPITPVVLELTQSCTALTLVQDSLWCTTLSMTWSHSSMFSSESVFFIMDPQFQNPKLTLQTALTNSSTPLSWAYSKQSPFNQTWHGHHSLWSTYIHPYFKPFISFLSCLQAEIVLPLAMNECRDFYCKIPCNHDTFIRHIITALSEL